MYGESIFVVSQLPVAKLHEYINEPTVADAILDRMTANAGPVDLKEESMRSKTTRNQRQNPIFNQHSSFPLPLLG
jgi:DNA replication protein DnaC